MLTPEQIEWLQRNKAMSGASGSAPAASPIAAGMPQNGAPNTMFQFTGLSAAPGGPTVGPLGKPTSASRLDELAKDPRKAHRAWKTLSAAEQTTVTNKMAAIYDKKFADEFAAVAHSGKPDFTLI